MHQRSLGTGRNLSLEMFCSQMSFLYIGFQGKCFYRYFFTGAWYFFWLLSCGEELSHPVFHMEMEACEYAHCKQGGDMRYWGTKETVASWTLNDLMSNTFLQRRRTRDFFSNSSSTFSSLFFSFSVSPYQLQWKGHYSASDPCDIFWNSFIKYSAKILEVGRNTKQNPIWKSTSKEAHSGLSST